MFPPLSSRRPAWRGLTLEGDEAVFDIPALLDATLQFCEPAGHA